MSKSDLNKAVKKALFVADALEKIVNISRAIDDLSEGIEEIEKSISASKSKNYIKEYMQIKKDRRDTH